MSRHEPVPERVHAFVDDQLHGADKHRFLDQVAHDRALQEQVCATRHLKEFVAAAFDDLPQPPVRAPGRGRGVQRWGLATAAAVLLALGFLLGRVGQPPMGVPGELAELSQPLTVAHDAQANRVLLHLAESDAARFGAALDRIERVLQRYREADMQLEVIANGGGLDMLRVDTSPYVERVRELMRRHPNLHLVACANTLDRLREHGIQPTLVEETRVAPAAIDHIVDRLRAGWVYIRV